MENITYLSDRIQNCLNEIFYTSYQKNEDFIKSITEISGYLISESNEYDNILNKYVGVDKGLLNQMILSNFSEITYYRRKNGVQLDEVRLNILNSVETADLNNHGAISLLYCDIDQFATMVNDVLLYFWHPSPMYSYNIAKSMSEDDFAKNVYQIYPLAMNEHMLTLNDTYTEKEFLLYTLIESMVNATERLTFSKGEYPVPDPGHMQEIANLLKEHNGSNLSVPNLHKVVLEEFNSKTGITQGNNYDKILILEILLQTIVTKHRCCIPTDKDEKYIFDELNQMELTIENISNFYDNNEQKVVSTLINDWNMFSNETMLLDTNIFNDIKHKEIKIIKKRFDKN